MWEKTMISPVTEKYNREAEQLQIDKDAAHHKLEVDLERWNKAELSGSSISMDRIIKDDLLCHDSAPRIIKLMLTGHQDDAMKLLIETYDSLAKDAITEAVDAHFWKD